MAFLAKTLPNRTKKPVANTPVVGGAPNPAFQKEEPKNFTNLQQYLGGPKQNISTVAQGTLGNQVPKFEPKTNPKPAQGEGFFPALSTWDATNDANIADFTNKESAFNQTAQDMQKKTLESDASFYDRLFGSRANATGGENALDAALMGEGQSGALNDALKNYASTAIDKTAFDEAKVGAGYSQTLLDEDTETKNFVATNPNTGNYNMDTLGSANDTLKNAIRTYAEGRNFSSNDLDALNDILSGEDRRIQEWDKPKAAEILKAYSAWQARNAKPDYNPDALSYFS